MLSLADHDPRTQLEQSLSANEIELQQAHSLTGDRWKPGNFTVLDFVFAGACAIGGVATCVVFGMGGYVLVTSALMLLLFAISVVLSPRIAILGAFGFSLFQPVFTRIIYSFDFPDAIEQSMIGYKDPLTTAASLLLIAAAGVALVYHLHAPLGSIHGLLTGAIALYVVVNVLQCLNPSTSFTMAVYGVKNNVTPLLMLFAGAFAIRTPKDTVRFVRFIGWFSVVALSYGLFQEIAGFVGFEAFWHSRVVPKDNSMYHFFVGDIEVRDPYIATTVDARVPSVFQGYTYYSYVIAAYGIIVYSAKNCFSTPIARVVRISTLILLGAYFAVSLERASIVMFGIGILAVHFAISQEKKRMFRFMLAGGICVVIVAGAFNAGSRFLIEQGFVSGNAKLIRITELTNPLTASTVTIGRFRHHWPEAMEIIREHPLIGTGAGTGMYTRGVDKNSSFIMPHNEFLQKLLELGPIGLALFVALLFMLYGRLLAECVSRENSGTQRAYAAGMIGVLAAYVSCGVMNVPFIYQPGVVFWFLAGAAIGGKRQIESQSEEQVLTG